MKGQLSPWRILAGLAFLLSVPFTPSCRATIRYEVSLEHPEQHVFHVTMTIPGVKDSVSVQMAAWNALYQIRDFSSHVRQVEALSGTERLPVEKLDKQTWRIEGTGDITIRYSTYWDEPGPFGTQLNLEHAFINPAMILMYVPERRAEAVELSVRWTDKPWRPAGAGDLGFEQIGRNAGAVASSGSFDSMADAPIEVGRIEEFKLEGIKPDIFVFVHGDNWHKKRVEEELRRICQYEIALMGGAPFDRYSFIFHVGAAAAGAGGGMEHANSTAIATSSDEYLAGVSAHEFFHLWNVKRIKPASLDPVDYTKEQYTRALWFAEGVTNTYGSYTLLRSGIWNKGQFFRDLSDQITELENRPANRWQSAEQSSLDAWLEKYPLYESGDSSISYYTKGQVLGVLLDIVIRDRTNNTKSLDDVLRAMNQEFAVAGKAYRDSLDIRLAAERIAGGSFDEFFKRFVSGVEPLVYSQLLPLAGLELRTSERSAAKLDFSGERGPGGGLVVHSVDSESAQRAGLRPGDIIQRWNDREPPVNIEHWLRSQRPGSELKLRVRRDGKELELSLRLGERKELFYEVKEDGNAGEKARRIREGMLHGVTQSIAAATN